MAEMSILAYFSKERNHDTGGNSNELVIPSAEDSGIPKEQYDRVIEQLIVPGGKKKRCIYTEKDKLRITICANQVGITNAIQFYKKDFPHLNESTLRGWLSKFRAELKRKSPTDLIQISSKRGRPLLLDENLDTVLRTFIINLRLAGGTVDRHSVHGVLMGIIKSNLTRYGGYLDFTITNGWIQSLYARMNMSRRMVTTSRPIVTRALWNEVRDQFLNEIVAAVALHNIPDELIINVDQTPSKFVPTGNFTMAGTNSKHVAKKGSNDKRGMTITLAETLSGKMLPFQLIYHGKTARSLPSVPFPEGFLLSYNEKHWSNEQETNSLLMKVLKPYVDRTKEELGLGIDQEFLLIWDAFKAQGTYGTCKTLEELNAIPVITPKNLTHLLQPLDLSTNRSFKNFEKKAFSNYFTKTITAAMLQEPDRDITTIDVDFKLSTLKPKHGRLMGELFNFFNSEKGMEIIKAGWSYSGITSAITNARNGDMDFLNLDPYKDILFF